MLIDMRSRAPTARLAMAQVKVEARRQAVSAAVLCRLQRAVQAASADDKAVRAAFDLTEVIVAAEAARAYANAWQADGALANSHAEIAEDQVTIFLALGRGWE